MFSWFGSLGEDGEEVAICTGPDNEAALVGVEGAEEPVRGSSQQLTPSHPLPSTTKINSTCIPT
jgi:hypothetical protein